LIVAITVATKDNFESLINDNDLVIIDFWAPWCGPCRGFAPTFEAASDKYDDVVFAKVNTDEQQELAAAFQIRSIPTLMVFRQKIIVFAQPGALPGSALDTLVEKAKALNMEEVRNEIAAQSTKSASPPSPA
jgi:thioredoxin 1